MKTASDDQLIAAIRKVSAGSKVVSPEIAKAIKTEQSVINLTQRQMEILESVTRGLTNEDIAKMFNITTSGVKQHLSAIFAKLGASSRSEAVAIALRKQLLKVYDKPATPMHIVRAVPHPGSRKSMPSAFLLAAR